MKALRIHANTMSLIVQFTAVQSHVLQNNPAVWGRPPRASLPSFEIRPSRSWRRGPKPLLGTEDSQGNGGQEQGHEPGQASLHPGEYRNADQEDEMEVQHPEVDQAGDGPGKGHPEFPCHEDREGGLPAPHGQQVVEEVVQKDKPEGTQESSRCGRMEIDVDPNGPEPRNYPRPAKGLRQELRADGLPGGQKGPPADGIVHEGDRGRSGARRRGSTPGRTDTTPRPFNPPSSNGPTTPEPLHATEFHWPGSGPNGFHPGSRGTGWEYPSAEEQ